MNKTEATPWKNTSGYIDDAEGYWVAECRTKEHAELIVKAVNNYDRLVNGIEKYIFHWDKFFGEPKVGQPPSLDELRQLLNDIKKP